MNITVYLGASEIKNERLAAAAAELGVWIAENGHTLIYGGSKVGLMGILAAAVIRNGGKAIGVEPRMFIEAEVQYDELTELIVTDDMVSRKSMMIEMGDAFIAFPGGTGTLEEISEVISLNALGMLDVPCMFYDIDGYYEGLRMQMERMKKDGLSTEKRLGNVSFVKSIAEIERVIRAEEQ